MKRTILLILLSVLMLMTCSCEVATPTVEPTSATTEALNSTPTVLPSTTPLLTTTTTPSAEPTKTPTPTLEDTLPHPTTDYSGGPHMLLSTGTLSDQYFEIYCNEDGSEKHLSINVKIDSKQKDFTEKIGNKDYEYTWLMAYHNADIYVEGNDDLIGYYTVTPKVFEKLDDGNIVYKLPISSAPEGDLTKNIKADEVDMLIIIILKDNSMDSFIYCPIFWTETDIQIRDNFYTSNSN